MKRFYDHDTEHIQDECGVFAIYRRDDMPMDSAYFAMQALQHRGQESAGIAASDGKHMFCHKKEGLVGSVFDEDALARLKKQQLLIGHVRYTTKGMSSILNAQPFLAYGEYGPFAVAHNGQIVNADKLRRDLQKLGAVFMTESDSEIFLHLFARNAHLGAQNAVREIARLVKGSYGLVILTLDQIIAVRDPYGIRPLCIGKRGETYMAASESSAFNVLGAELVRDVAPGEMILFDQNGITSHTIAPSCSNATCVFEYVYFARNDSVIDGVPVVDARLRLGAALSQVMPVEADLVAGVPDSALMAAIGYSRKSGIPYGDALVKNRYVGRTFIQPTQSLRELGVRVKLSALPYSVNGKRIVLVDDSIVRGTTSRNLIDMLRAAGAKEVHMRISSPPVSHPCFYGIDTPSERQLISATKNVEQIRAMIGADTLAYLDMPMMLESVSHGTNGYCAACFDGNYPVDLRGARRCGMK